MSYLFFSFCAIFLCVCVCVSTPSSRANAAVALLFLPMKAAACVVWRKSRVRVAQCVAALFALYFLISFIYSLPGYTVKRMLGA